ncbi:xanthine dehydrogenase family protein subunit M [Sulfitobacter sp. S190]|uniref:FAD binding domain-containing protein n=1 Tax=Sulfitobacter sp. S190 TaxID=2867022 RepID=UPI0021A59773|nr:xanthine dehydrogenase family protein subunit M [Sulfitobacter sp. S190]UWR24282.1 xanthine dehydrogenase family protein subunit M [Sulfitobacter sp. S190]
MTYHAPTTLDAALQVAARAGGKVVAGGTDVYPSARQGVQPDHYLDVTRIADLKAIERATDGYTIGAAVTWSEVQRADLPPAFDALRQAAREVGSVQIQNAGTVVGNICNASPAADGVPPLMVLDAHVDLASAARGKRRVPLEEFLKGVRSTDLAPDELVTGIFVPTPSPDARSAFEKLGSRRYLVISITMVAALVETDAQGCIRSAKISVGAAAPTARRLHDLEQAVVGLHPSDLHVSEQHLGPLAPIDDTRGSAAYRRDVAAEQCKRALQKACGYE